MYDQKVTYFGETNFRNQQKRFGIKKGDRRKHMYIIGKTGMGKTTLLENLAMQDIQSGEGLAFIDPHGETAYKLLDFVPKERINDVIYFDPADTAFPIGLNVMENVDPERRHFVASGLMSVFKKIFGPDVWSARMEYILGNTILALLEYPSSTLLSINPMLAVKEFRKKVVASVSDPVISTFWTQEFAKYTERFAAEATPAIQNKVGQFTSNPLIRNIIGQTNSTIDMRKIMDEKKILIVNLAKGRVGEDTARLLGAMIVTKLYLAAMSRVDILDEARRADFFLYVDEFQNFATESFANILSEARKYRLSLILAHQYMAQLAEEVRDAVIGNVGTLLTFRVGAEDAEFLEKELGPDLTALDIVNIGFAQVYLKLMIDGVASRPFSATTLPPIQNKVSSFRDEILTSSRKNYGKPRAEVEKKINQWMSEMDADADKRAGSREGRSAGLSGILPTSDRGVLERNTLEPRFSQGQNAAVLYDAVCFVCGKNTKVPFQPDPNRPVFCKEHIGLAGKVKDMAQERRFAPRTRPSSGEFALRPPRFEDRQARLQPPPVSLSQLERKSPPRRDFGTPNRERSDFEPRKNEQLQALREALKKSRQEHAENAGNIDITPTETEKSNGAQTLRPGDRLEL